MGHLKQKLRRKRKIKRCDMTKNIDKTFMEAYQDLVDAANNITKQTTSIDESMKLFDQGMKDAELCNKNARWSRTENWSFQFWWRIGADMYDYNEYKALIEEHLLDYIPKIDIKAQTLFESMKYSVTSGGKSFALYYC